MNLAYVMQSISDRLDTIDGLRCFAYPPPTVSPPAAIVTYPDRIAYDEAYVRGMDRIKLPVVLAVGKVSDRTARDRIGVYCDGSGAQSVKAVLESGTYSAFDTVVVTGVDFSIYTEASTSYLAATFDLDITGSGS